MIDAARARHDRPMTARACAGPPESTFCGVYLLADHVWTCREIAALLDWCRMAR